MAALLALHFSVTAVFTLSETKRSGGGIHIFAPATELRVAGRA